MDVPGQTIRTSILYVYICIYIYIPTYIYIYIYLVGGLEYELTMVINHLPPIMGQSMGFDETINRNLQLVGGLEPWNFMTFPISWECHHPI